MSTLLQSNETNQCLNSIKSLYYVHEHMNICHMNKINMLKTRTW